MKKLSCFFFFFFEQRRSRPLKCGKCANERAPPPLTHKGCRTDWKKHKWDNFALPHRRNTNAQRQLRFQNILQLVEWSSQRAVLHVLHRIFMLMMCVWKVLNGDSRVSTTSWPIIDVGSATNQAKSQAGLKAHRGIWNSKRKYPDANGCNF